MAPSSGWAGALQARVLLYQVGRSFDDDEISFLRSSYYLSSRMTFKRPFKRLPKSTSVLIHTRFLVWILYENILYSTDDIIITRTRINTSEN